MLMKKFLQTLAFTLLMSFGISTNSSAQWINSINMVPTNPTSIDSITFYAHVSFSSGNCDPVQKILNSSGNNVFGFTQHCLGILSFICYYTDTFIIPPLAAGNHKFIFHLESGLLPACIPGIVAGPTDSLAFTVSAPTGINEATTTSSFSIKPNPSNGNFILHLNKSIQNKKSQSVELFNLSGIKIETILIENENTEIKNDLPSGIYLCRLKNDPSSIQKLVIVN